MYVYCSTGLCSRPNEHNTKFNVIFIAFSHMLTTSKSTCHTKFLFYHYIVHVLCLFPLPSETLLPVYQTTMRQTSDDNCSVLFLNKFKNADTFTSLTPRYGAPSVADEGSHSNIWVNGPKQSKVNCAV